MPESKLDPLWSDDCWIKTFIRTKNKDILNEYLETLTKLFVHEHCAGGVEFFKMSLPAVSTVIYKAYESCRYMDKKYAILMLLNTSILCQKQIEPICDPIRWPVFQRRLPDDMQIFMRGLNVKGFPIAGRESMFKVWAGTSQERMKKSFCKWSEVYRDIALVMMIC